MSAELIDDPIRFVEKQKKALKDKIKDSFKQTPVQTCINYGRFMVKYKMTPYQYIDKQYNDTVQILKQDIKKTEDKDTLIEDENVKDFCKDINVQIGAGKHKMKKRSIKNPTKKRSVKKPTKKRSVKKPTKKRSVKKPMKKRSVKKPTKKRSVRKPTKKRSVRK
jgi:hypothetical protein